MIRQGQSEHQPEIIELRRNIIARRWRRLIHNCNSCRFAARCWCGLNYHCAERQDARKTFHAHKAGLL